MSSEATILSALIARLEPKVGDLARDRRRHGEPLPNGIGFLVQALRIAKAALASGSPDEIRIAALHAPPMERTGNELQQAKRQRDESARRQEEKTAARSVRQKGGKARGVQQAAEADARWRPYVSEFQKLINAGMNERMARAKVEKQMQKDGFTIPATEAFPSSKTIKNRLLKK